MTKLIIIIAILVFVVALFAYSPTYLTYADKPVKSDVIVLFVGPDFNAREKEARKLIEEGYAQHLIVPAYGTVYDFSILTNKTNPTNPTNKPLYPSYYENTHIEVLEAKRMMDKAGFKSAIFVSSPYHMRRIKTMVEWVFNSALLPSEIHEVTAKHFTGAGTQHSALPLRLVPTQYEKIPGGFWMFSNNAIENVASEYAKMVWFFAYIED